MKEPIDSTYLTVKKIFIDYLQQMKLRKTPERFAILREIYSTNSHFDIDSLYNQMKNNKYLVSRATLYNTMELLLDSGLVIKHQFGHNCSQYEKSYKFRQHDHFIDVEDNTVLEFCDPRILEIQKSIEEQFGVEITHHSLTFYGRKKVESEKLKDKSRDVDSSRLNTQSQSLIVKMSNRLIVKPL